jgi:hypothetical protein
MNLYIIYYIILYIMPPNDPYYFPFDKVNPSELVKGNVYYMKLNDNILRDFEIKRRNIPVSHLEGVFVRNETIREGLRNVEYSVFKDVRIMNKAYKPGSCRFLLVRYPDAPGVSAIECDTFSDANGRTINQDREVYLDRRQWVYGIPFTQSIMVPKVLDTLRKTTKLPEDTLDLIKGYTKRGGKRSRRIRKKSKRRTCNKRTCRRRV